MQLRDPAREIRRLTLALPFGAIVLAAATLVAGPAGALDKAAVAPSLEPCPSKGPGFVRVPGSRSCTRLSGRAAAGADLRTGPGASASPVAEGRFAIDNRADTEFGEVRTYVRIGNGRR